MPDSEPITGFDLGEPPAPKAVQVYRVLARKYRPQKFSELIGQEAMVTTLGNAIKRGRLAHAFLMTGVRGVGKTSTARLMAKALNCEKGPTIETCGVCDACVAITEGRHIDVIEMDAASNTGVDDVREIIDAVRYSAVSARFKVYIIDEVHMLSKNAFNALLKTLEEPPPHVKFIFATTEIQKVPITVLSRCQRFDLRRIPADMLDAHFQTICGAEGVSADPEAIALIARAAEGSVRDGLSILDQAISHADMEGSGLITGEQVRAMLGLSDRGALRTLFQSALEADALSALALLKDQHELGVEPVAVLKGLLEICHGTTLVKVGSPVDPAQSEEERATYQDWAADLSFPLLHRIWQLLLKGHEEVSRASDPQEAAEMAVLRIIHASQMPDPGELIKKLENGAPLVATGQALGRASKVIEPPADFAGLITLLSENGKALAAQQLHDYVGLVRYAPGTLALRPTKPLPADFLKELSNALKGLTGMNWTVTLADEVAAPSLREQELLQEGAARDAILATPMVVAAMQAFPDAILIEDEANTAG
jgi:DNA polymerase III subunit gamma/tau